MSGESRKLTLEDVAKHNKESDVWIAIHGKVYDVTHYLDDHPGGGEVISDLAGMDTTVDFDDVGHSEEAIEQLDDFLVGELVADEVEPMAAPSEQAKAPAPPAPEAANAPFAATR